MGRLCLSVLLLLFLLLANNLFGAEPVIRAGSSPDNNYRLLCDAISSAKKSIDINIYEFYSEKVAKALLRKARQGIRIRMLMEGRPAEGFQARARLATRRFYNTFKRCSRSEMRIMWAKKSSDRRYTYNHAKYTIIDRKKVVVGSENYNSTGQPSDIQEGNRGWQVLINDPRVASTYLRRFEKDYLTSSGDVVTTRSPVFRERFLPRPGDKSTEKNEKNNDYSQPARILDVFHGKCRTRSAFSPDNAAESLVRLIDSAQHTLFIQQMTFQPYWKVDNKKIYVSPLLKAIRRSLKRGVEVKILLNDPSSFGKRPPDKFVDISMVHSPADISSVTNTNWDTIRKLLEYRYDDHLPVSAFLSQNKAMGVNYIHNKGVVVDNNAVLISSINWGRNSIVNNREAGVVVTCPDVAGYYSDLFLKDWENTLNELFPR